MSQSANEQQIWGVRNVKKQLDCFKAGDCNVDPAYLSAFAALAGSAIGGLTSFAAAWVTQRQQANVQWLLQDKSRRQDLYKQFIEEASNLYADALAHDHVNVSALVSVYALMSRIRILSSPDIVERADIVVRLIVDTYSSPTPRQTRPSPNCGL